MTPKEKAQELVNKFKIGDVVTEKLQIVNINIYSKLFALKAVDEILYITEHESPSTYVYYVKVKQEIEKL